MSDYEALRDLEARRDGPFTYRVGGREYPTVSPSEIDFETLLWLLQEESIPGLPNMRVWQVPLVFERWVAHHDLPDFAHAQRLAYVVNRYRDVLEHDLHIHAHADLTALWRGRRWRFLLNLIDRLPRHSFYSEAVANDPEHARMLIEAMEARREAAGEEEEGPSGPPLHTWSPEVAAIVDLTDAVRRVEYAVVAVQAEKGKGPKPPEPLPRPRSIFDVERKRAEYARRKAKHNKLALRMLPHKRDAEAE